MDNVFDTMSGENEMKHPWRFVMDAMERLKKTILKEYNNMCTGDGYIENAADAYRFLGHLAFLASDGQEGEENTGFEEGV